MISSVSSSIAAIHRVAGAPSRPPSVEESGRPAVTVQLTEEQQQQVERLKERDREVRAHEQAHARAGGPHAGAPSYEFQRGPDGRMYAVSGEVQIDTAPISGNPAATIAKMELVVRAALAPQDPSAQDRRVAAEAQTAKAEAQAELRQQKQAESRGATEDAGGAHAGAHSHAAQAYENAESLIFTLAANPLSVAA